MINGLVGASQHCIPIAFMVTVLNASSTVGTNMLIPLVLLTRVLLFAPYLVAHLGIRRADPHARMENRTHVSVLDSSIAAVLLVGWQSYLVFGDNRGQNGKSFKLVVDIINALGESSAVAALGWDLLIAGASLGVIIMQPGLRNAVLET